MDTRGPEHDVHPSDCTQFTGKNVFHFTLLVSGSVCANCIVLLCFCHHFCPNRQDEYVSERTKLCYFLFLDCQCALNINRLSVDVAFQPWQPLNYTSLC